MPIAFVDTKFFILRNIGLCITLLGFHAFMEWKYDRIMNRHTLTLSTFIYLIFVLGVSYLLLVRL